MLDAIQARIEAQVPILAHRTQTATGLSNVLRNKAVPAQTPAAYVTPIGLTASSADVATGSYVQAIQETVGIVLFLRAGTQTADQALREVQALLREIITALIGWTPGDESGSFTFRQGRLMSFAEGLLIYQLDFAIDDHLRKAT